MHRGEMRAYRGSLVTDLLTPLQTDILLDRLWHLEQVDDIGEVLRLTQI